MSQNSGLVKVAADEKQNEVLQTPKKPLTSSVQDKINESGQKIIDVVQDSQAVLDAAPGAPNPVPIVPPVVGLPAPTQQTFNNLTAFAAGQRNKTRGDLLPPLNSCLTRIAAQDLTASYVSAVNAAQTSITVIQTLTQDQTALQTYITQLQTQLQNIMTTTTDAFATLQIAAEENQQLIECINNIEAAHHQYHGTMTTLSNQIRPKEDKIKVEQQ